MYPYVTLAKAIGILLVVAGHFTSQQYMPNEYMEFKEWIFSFHMPLFMILSGFLFQSSWTKMGDGKPVPFFSFMKKKFCRLIVPYLFLSLCIAFINFVLGQFIKVKTPVDGAYLLHMLYENVGGSAVFLWFVYALFVIFLVVALCSRVKFGTQLIGVLGLVLYFLPIHCGVFYISSVCSHLVYFWLGMMLFKKKDDAFKPRYALAGILLFVGGYAVRFENHLSALSLLVACAGSYVVLGISYLWSKYGKVGNLRMNIGRYSAYIYLLHMAGVFVVRLIFEKVHIFTPFAYFVALAVAIVSGVTFSMLLTKEVIYRSKLLTFLMGGK